MRLSMDLGLGSVALMGGGYAFVNAEAADVAARFTTPPTNARKALIDNMVGALKTGGVWPKGDGLYLVAGADSQAARRNWIADQYNLTAVSAPTFTADQGYAGNGSTSYLTSGFNPVTAGGKFALNSASLFVWVRNVADAATLHFAGNNTAKVGRNTAGTSVRTQANDGTGQLPAATLTGLLGFSRGLSTSYSVYRNGALVAAPVVTTTAMTSASFDFCRSSEGSYSASQIAAGFFGENLTADEALALYNAINTYLAAIGAA